MSTIYINDKPYNIDVLEQHNKARIKDALAKCKQEYQEIENTRFFNLVFNTIINFNIH